MIVSVISADGSTTLRRLEDHVKKRRKTTRRRRNNWKSKPQPKFNQFDKEFKQFDSCENELEPRFEVETSKIEIPNSFKHTTPITQSSIQNEVNAIQVPQIFKSNNTHQTKSPKVEHRRKPLQKNWPPEPVKKQPAPENPTRFYF